MEKYKNQNVLVYGYGKTGKDVSKFLAIQGANVFMFDDKDDIKEINIKTIDFAVVSPGVSMDKPMIKELKNNNKKIISELEIASENVQGKIVAITGTNGKTTTVSLIYEILKRFSKNTIVAGNIGKPLISFFNQTNNRTLIALEVSSFQLESCENFCPKISAILNFATDHLDRHKSLEEYQKCKEKIFSNQTKNDFCVLNFDDEICQKMSRKTLANTYYFSLKNIVKGAFCEKEKIYFSNGKNSKNFVMKTSEIKLLGEKNLENVLASVCIAKLLKIPNKIIKEVVENFMPLEHRLEFVKTISGVNFINDSKATNIASTLADLTAFSCPVSLILGGSDKGENFDDLFHELRPKVMNIIVFGETSKKIKDSANKYRINVIEEKTLKNAVKTAYYLSKSGYSVLFAPACASFDMFENYVQRGNCFKEIVEEIEYEVKV